MSHIIASITLAIPAMILAETALSLPRSRPAAADHLVGRAAARGAEHPLDRDRALAVRARRHRGHRRHGAQSSSATACATRPTLTTSDHVARSQITRQMLPTAARTATLLEVRDLATHFPVRNGIVKAVDGVSFDVAPRPHPRDRRRKRFGQERHGPLDPADRRCARPHRGRLDRCSPRRTARSSISPNSTEGPRDPRRARRRDRDDLPGADVVALAGAHGRRPDRRGAPAASRDEQEGGTRAHASSC